MNHLNENTNAIDSGSRICIFDDGSQSVYTGRWSRIGTPVEQGQMQAWDGVDARFTDLIASRIPGVVVFCKITVTGRKVREYASDSFGVAARIEFADGRKASAMIAVNR